MAETVKINDIASQLNTASRLVVDTDFFWIYMGNGTQVKIPAEWVRAYLTNGITPTVDENGHWIVGGTDTGVVAEGKTPQFRGGVLGIEVSYDKGLTWTQCVAYTDMNPELQPLIDAYNAIVDSEAGRVEAETLRVEAETARKNSWAAWFEDTTNGVKALWSSWFAATKKAWSDWFGATDAAGVRKTWSDWFEAIKQAWSEFNTAAQDAETARANAETLRSQAESARANAENIRREQEADRVSAEQARASAEETRQSQEATRVSQENARIQAEAARKSAWAAWFENATTGVMAVWNSWFGTSTDTGVQGEWTTLKTDATAATTSATNAAKAANEATAASQKQTESCKEATDLATELNEHPQKQGENGNWWKWNTETNEYEDTGIIARGGGMYPMVRTRRNHVIWYDSTDGFKERIVRRRNHTVIKL